MHETVPPHKSESAISRVSSWLDDRVGPLACREAFDILVTLGHEGETIFVGHQAKKITVRAFMTWLKDCDVLNERAASIAPVTFIGGPPNDQQWYTSNLRVLTLDRVFRAEVDSGMPDLLNTLLDGFTASK